MKAIWTISLAALCFGCAVDSKKSLPPSSFDQLSCEGEGQASHHAAIAARANYQAFAGCFKNYLKLNPETEDLKVRFCAHIKTDSQGGAQQREPPRSHI